MNWIMKNLLYEGFIYMMENVLFLKESICYKLNNFFGARCFATTVHLKYVF